VNIFFFSNLINPSPYRKNDTATLLREILPETKRRYGDFLQNPQGLVFYFILEIDLCVQIKMKKFETF
jgi:hypothetical protein